MTNDINQKLEVLETIQFSLTSPEFLKNLHPFHDKLRSVNPIYWGNLLKYPER